MRQIRAGVFETNSSSTHSITWDTTNIDQEMPAPQSLKVLVIDKDMMYEQRKFETPLEKMTLAFAFFNGDAFISREQLGDYVSQEPYNAFIRAIFNRMPELEAIIVKGWAGVGDNAGRIDREFEAKMLEEQWTAFLFDTSVCIERHDN